MSNGSGPSSELGLTILVSGGAGYIGSHTTLALLEAGYNPVIVDNFCNSERWIPERIEALAGRKLQVVDIDLRDLQGLTTAFASIQPSGVIHFAALKSVDESTARPLDYYDNNVCGTLNLLRAMASTGCQRLVFSSSATVYGDPEQCPISEDATLRAISPYGRTKLMMEQVIADIVHAQHGFNAAVLRYFNPAGAHPSGRLGELPRGKPNNLIPFVAQTAAGLHPQVQVFGQDYATRDGTGVRDYIHVVDLAAAHVNALRYMERHACSVTVNLGTGQGYSVLEILEAFGRAAGKPVPFSFHPRRSGDSASCYADPSLAAQLLGWRAQYGLDDICRDAWRWQQNLAQPT